VPFDLFQRFGSKEDLRAAEDRLLTYEYEVTRREETGDEVVVHIKCIHAPETGHLETP
jgi:hypothetical protein